MFRILVFLVVVLAAALGLAWVADRPGTVVVTWLGEQRETSVLVAMGLVLAVAVALMALWSLLNLIFRLPSLIAFASRARRRARGFHAISRGMIAVGAGDARGARRNAGEAQRLLGREPLTMLLTAQAAQLSGDRPGAEAAFSGMLESAETRVLGLRGLFVEARRKGDATAARFYAEEAYRLAPSVPWVGDAVLDYRCAEGDWRGALLTVEQNASRRLVDRETARRQRAVLLAADALERSATAPDAALKSALEALKLAPGLVPAASYAGRRIAEQGDYGRSAKLLETAWKLSPHPDVAEAYLDVRPGDSALDRLKRAKTLQRLQPMAAESRLTLARAAIDAREFRQAREVLEAVVLERPTVRACMLMAELEEKETASMGLVREWLSRASRAERDPVWVADGIVSEMWRPVSPVTGRLDAFVWEKPPQAPGSRLLAEIEADRVIADHDERPALTLEGPPTPEHVATAPPGAAPAGTPDAAKPVPANANAAVQTPEGRAESAESRMTAMPDDPGPEPDVAAPRQKAGLFS